MGREGQHSATLTVKGNARSANREMQALAQRQHSFERSIERTNTQLERQAAKLNKANAAGMKGAGAFGKLTGALSRAGGYAAAAAAAIAVTDQLASRMIDNVNVMTDLKFSMEEIVGAMDNMTTQHEAAGGAALLQSTNLQLTQRNMNELAQLTATVADKNKKDLVPSWDAVAKAIAKGNVDRLRAIGLNTDNAKLLDEVARATGRSTTQIGLAERQQIAYNEALRAMKEQAEIAGDSQDGLAFSFERMKNKSADAFDSVLRYLNDLPAEFAEFERMFRQGLEGALFDLGLTADETADAMAGLEEGFAIAVRAGTALVTFGMSELIPFLMEWETHLKTIDGLMGNMQEFRVSRGGLGAVGGAMRHAVDAFDAAQNPSAVDRATTGFIESVRGAQGALVDFMAAAEETSKKAKRPRGGGRRRRPVETIDRSFDGPTAVDSGDQTAELDRIQDAEFEAEVSRERRRAEVVALRQQNNQALLEADERARLRRAEIDIERAQRDEDEAALIAAKDERDEAMHDRNLRRMEEERRERIAMKEAKLRAIQAEVEAEEAAQRAREATFQKAVKINAAGNQLAAHGATVASLAASEHIKGEERRARFQQRMMGVQALSIGVLETVKAAAAFASLNPVQGAMHLGAASVAFARGGILMKGNVEGFGGGADAGGGATAGGAASGASRGPQGGRGTTESRSDDETPIPVSQPSDPIERDNPPTGGGQGGSVTVHIHAPMVTPDTVEQITRQQRDQARGRGIRVGA